LGNVKAILKSNCILSRVSFDVLGIHLSLLIPKQCLDVVQVGDRDRGYLLELLLTKLRYAAGGGEDMQENMSSTSIWHSELQIVGMSATMPNVSDVASWLQVPL
jgi:hypothetical protein